MVKKKMITPEVFIYMGGEDVPEDVTHVRVHESVKAIPQRAFFGLHHLKSVECHNGVERVGAAAFFLL